MFTVVSIMLICVCLLISYKGTAEAPTGVPTDAPELRAKRVKREIQVLPEQMVLQARTV